MSATNGSVSARVHAASPSREASMSNTRESDAKTKGDAGENGSGNEATERFGRGASKTVAIGYGFLMGTVVIALWGLLSAGKGLKAAQPKGGGVSSERAHASADK